MHLKRLGLSIILLLAACITPPTVTPSVVPSKPSETAPAIASASPGHTATLKIPQETAPASDTTVPKKTPPASDTTVPKKIALANDTPVPLDTPTPGPVGIAPYPDAPLCADSGEAHDNSLFHTLWDSVRGCHYDHEHGQNPFTPEVAATFPGFDLHALLGHVGVGHTNPSSPMENTHKHGGMKWNVQLVHPENCNGFESSTFGANASVIQYHSFGDEAIELEARVHSTVALVRQCSSDNPTDYGYVYVVQFQDYGQRIVPYQGTIVAYPNQPVPAYDSPRGPYISFDCVGAVIQCRPSLEDVLTHNRAVASNWASKVTTNLFTSGSQLFQLLFRLRDGYRLFDWNDQTYPFTFLWLCSNDDGVTYNPIGCRYNNSTTQVHEIAGSVPAAWDNLAGFDTDTRVGRITAEGYVTRFGDLNAACTTPGTDTDCFPIKMVNAFVGTWGSVLVYTTDKGTNIVPMEPSRDIFFCGTQVCAEGDPGAAPSGWIGPEN